MPPKPEKLVHRLNGIQGAPLRRSRQSLQGEVLAHEGLTRGFVDFRGWRAFSWRRWRRLIAEIARNAKDWTQRFDYTCQRPSAHYQILVPVNEGISICDLRYRGGAENRDRHSERLI